MKITNFDKAIINDSKIIDYLLSNSHPSGRNKAKFFNTLGYNKDNFIELIKEFRILISTNDYELIIENEFGTKFIVNGKIKAKEKNNAEITTVWFIEKDGTIPYFITAYPKGK
jgi:hypothetical protein